MNTTELEKWAATNTNPEESQKHDGNWKIMYSMIHSIKFTTRK